jgi:hypothetical protein
MDPVSPGQAEVVLTACRAAYKQGLIDAAQDVCHWCKSFPPIRRSHKDPWVHPDGECCAGTVHNRLAALGGWQVDWPEYSKGLPR